MVVTYNIYLLLISVISWTSYVRIGFDDERRQVPDDAEVQGLRQDKGD